MAIEECKMCSQDATTTRELQETTTKTKCITLRKE